MYITFILRLRWVTASTDSVRNAARDERATMEFSDNQVICSETIKLICDKLSTPTAPQTREMMNEDTKKMARRNEEK